MTNQNTRRVRRFGVALLLPLLFSGCVSTVEGAGTVAPAAPAEVDESIYTRYGDPNDPFREKYAEFHPTVDSR